MGSKIYFLTRSFPGIFDHGHGGAMVRKAYVDLLKERNYKVWIVMPNYSSKQSILNKKDKIILIPYTKNATVQRHLQKLGVVEDYLDDWVKRATSFLKDIVTKKDVLFSTAGGELATIKLASKLKDIIGCPAIINLHDPILYTTANSKKIYPHHYIPHINRDSFEIKYLRNQDLIITSSISYSKSLKAKYPELKDRITYNHFGYITKTQSIIPRDLNETLNIVYGGNMGETQAPEILAEAAYKMKGIRLFFIGDYERNKKLMRYKEEVTLINKMPYEQYQKFLFDTADIGFVSLRGPLSSLCVPSKIYEYINLNLPVLGSLDNQDSKTIIEDNGFGIICSRNHKEISAAIEKFRAKRFWKDCYNNIAESKDDWEMKNKIKEVFSYIDKLLDEYSRR